MAEYVADWLNAEVNPHEVESALRGVTEALDDPEFRAAISSTKEGADS